MPVKLYETISFTKMHGLGNDYVYIDTFANPVAEPERLAPRISDRRRGVGGDGLVLIGPSDEADARMRIFNIDGSEAEMCGNAIRCVGKYLYESGRVRSATLRVETLAGIRLLRLFMNGNRVERVRVDMGRPSFLPADLPMNAAEPSFLHRGIEVDGKEWRGTAVSVGNPHFVVPVDDPAALDLERIGPLFEHHPLFPRRVNTEFVRVLAPDLIDMRVWERGSGETAACGTGACAVLAACAANGFSARSAQVRLPGGPLSIEWDSDDILHMTGPAETVCAGDYILPPETL